MQTCISRHATARLTLVGTRLGAKVAKAVMLSIAAGKLTPEILGEALISSSTVRGHVQQEAVRLLVVRVSMRTPQQLQWLLHLIGSYAGGLSASDALTSLAKRSLFYQVASFGLRGTVASAITTAALQVSINTCTLLTSNASFWRRSNSRMSFRQYRYELLTSLYSSLSTVAGGAAGAAVGSMLMPGIGTAFGSVIFSVGGGYAPAYLRDKRGPDDCCRQQVAALRSFTPLRMIDTAEGEVFMSEEGLVEKTCTRAPVTGTLASRKPKGIDSPKCSGDAQGESGSGGVAADTDEDICVEGNEEVVWLDFDVAEHPSGVASATSSIGAAENFDGVVTNDSSSMRSCLRYSPSLALMSRRLSFEGAHVDAMQSPTRVASDDTEAVGDGSPTTVSCSSRSSLWADALDTATLTASTSERFQGHAMYVTASTPDELHEKLEKCGGEDDVIFLFA